MTIRGVEISPQGYARVAGLLYLIVIVAGIFAEIFVRGQLVVANDAAATAHNIVTHELQYRLGFAAELIALLCNVPLALIFYELFKVVNTRVTFSLVGTAIESVDLLNHLAPLTLLGGGGYLSAIPTEQLQAQAYLSLKLFELGFAIWRSKAWVTWSTASQTSLRPGSPPSSSPSWRPPPLGKYRCAFGSS